MASEQIKVKNQNIPIPDHHKFTVEEVDFFRENLLEHYEKTKRELPWRIHVKLLADASQRAYFTWVSEVMLQQTQVVTVIDYYNKWITKWPTIKALANATLDEVNETWSGLGYYSRGRRLHEAAQKLSKLKGDDCCQMPGTAKALMKELPGVGRYTACAIASIAYNHVTGVVDGNVMRVLSRLRNIGSEINTQLSMELFWYLANVIVDPNQPGDFNQALMELGALICTPKAPKCSECPVRNICKAYARQSRGGVDNRKITDAFRRGSLGYDTDDDDVIDLAFGMDDIAAEGKEGDKGKNTEEIGNNIADKENQVTGEFDDSLKSAKAEKCPISIKNSLDKEYVLTDIEDVPECLFCLSPEEPWNPLLGVLNYPRKGKKKPPGAEHFLSIVIENDNKYLFSQRPNKGLLANMWEFPLTQVEKEDSETVEISIVRKELKRRFSIVDGKKPKLCGEVSHVFSHKFHIYRVYFVALPKMLDLEEDSDGRKISWMSEDEAVKAAITKAIRKIMAVKNGRLSDTPSTKRKRKEKGDGKSNAMKGQQTIEMMMNKKPKL